MFIKKILLAAFLIVAGSVKGQQNILAGHWEGAISRLGSVQLLKFDLYPVGDSIEIQYDDPAKGYYHAFLEGGKKISGNDSTFDLNFGYGNFHCVLNKQYVQITGSNKNWNPEVLFHLKKSGSREEDPYRAEDFSFNNDAVKLASTIYKPKTTGPYPVVILIHGSDEQTRRTTYIRSLVYVLTKNGIGVVVYDKRGTGSSGGNMYTASYTDFANDALACIRYIKQRKDLRVSKIGLLGTSAGGWIAPMVANKNAAVDFVILNSGPAVSTFKQDMDRVEYALRSNDADEKTIDSALQHSKLYFDAVKENTGWEKLERSVALYQNKTWATETAQLQLPKKMNDEDMLWWRSHNYDPAGELSKIKCRVLSFMGENDDLVPPATNKPLMEKYLTKAGCTYKIIVLPRAGHDGISFQTLIGGNWKWPTQYWVWPHRPKIYYDEIVKWIKGK